MQRAIGHQRDAQEQDNKESHVWQMDQIQKNIGSPKVQEVQSHQWFCKRNKAKKSTALNSLKRISSIQGKCGASRMTTYREKRKELHKNRLLLNKRAYSWVRLVELGWQLSFMAKVLTTPKSSRFSEKLSDSLNISSCRFGRVSFTRNYGPKWRGFVKFSWILFISLRNCNVPTGWESVWSLFALGSG